MTKKQIGAILAVVILAVAAPLVLLALLHALDGETQAAPAANGQQDTIKWEQLPDLTPSGLDVFASNKQPPTPPPFYLADDFQCTQTGPITQIEFWGSWYHDMPPQGNPNNVSFTLNIHSNVPGTPFSHPSDSPLWTWVEGTGECVATPEASGMPEGFYIPGPEMYEFPADYQVWRYTCTIASWKQFIQQGTPEQPVIYWLDVQAVYADPNPQVLFGWKTSYQHWQDDAVWATGTEPGPFTWSELRYPAGHPQGQPPPGQSIDLAFRIWGQPPTPQADLEKVDVYVKPFYCGDTDMDGDEATGARVPAGRGTCCDGVDNDGNTLTDGQDPKCTPHINEDSLDGVDNDGDGYEGEDRPGVGCPWNGDDDCDGAVDEDPTNGIDDDGDMFPYIPNYPCPPEGDPKCDEDPANGFLGIDNDGDYLIDEDGGGRFDWDGDTEVDAGEEQLEGVDDDGDTRVDEDPLDSPAKLWIDGQPKLHEAHYLVNEVLLNNGPTSPVTALDTTELDAPAYRADLKEDGFTTCNDNLNNDGDAGDGCDVDGCPGIGIYDPDPQCVNPHIGEEAAGLHACNDDLDNGAGWSLGDGLTDELDIDDCGTVSEVSVECKWPTDVISVKDGVPWYIKPPSNSPLTLQHCPQYFDPDHSNKCVPCKIPMGVGPIDVPCMMVTQPEPWQPGYCVAADSVPDVEKELELHRPVTLTTGVEVIEEQQLDVACDEWTSLHPFSIYNVLEPPEEIIDPDLDNNQKGTRMLVACTAYTHGYLSDLSGPSPPRNLYVTYADISPVIVNANNGESSVQDFIVTLEAQSPGLGIGGPEGLKDTDGDDWADNVEGLLRSDPGDSLKTPESIHVPGSCSDGDDNDLMWGKDAADPKCVDTDGDGYSDGEEWMFGSSPSDPDKTPEQMQFPWTCYDGVDNDDDGQSENAEGDGPDTDGWGDCSIDQLTAIRPPVMCASGWMAAAGATYDITLAGNGDLSVAINKPVLGLSPGEARPVAGESVFNCFQPGDYPPQTILASIRPANPHVVDLLPTEPLQTSFTGTASCVGGEADLQVKDWMFGPAPSYILPLEEWEDWDTAKEIYNAGPDPAEQVRVRKEMNLPAQSCHGYVTVAYAGETIGIAEGALYRINDVGDWYFGPAELVEDGVNLKVGDTVHVADPFGAVPAITPELSAWFLLPDPIPASSTAFAEEDMGVWCWQVGDYPFFFSNQVTLVGYPNVCDPTVGNISMDLMLEAHARDCSITGDTDSDLSLDNVECYLETDPLDACPDVVGADDAWPLDISMDKAISVVGDVSNYAGRIGAHGPPDPSAKWMQRLDLNMDNHLTVVGDVSLYSGKIGKKCT
ncbi:MAG: hypothetical protein MUP14_06100 [Dehalococcoidia bacterium]|nr:hypothetical protein [Dehalococcoidia bacterium]